MVAVAIGGAAVLGAGASIYSASKAAGAQKDAANKALQVQQQQYQQTRSDLAPYRDTGSTALSQYSNLLGLNGQDAATKALTQYTQSPYLSQLVKNTGNAVDASRAARGGLFSGQTGAEIGDRTGQLYLGDYNNYLSRLSGQAQMGQSAATGTAQFGANSANQQGGYITNAGNAQASADITGANSVNNLLSQLAGTYGAYKGGAFGSQGGGSSSPWNNMGTG